MKGLVLFLGYDRRELMIGAFISLAAAGVIVSLGAWILLWRYRRRRVRPVPEQTPPP